MLNTSTHKQAIVLRSDLRDAQGHRLRKGKLVAQGAHASLNAVLSQAKLLDGVFRLPANGDIGAWLNDCYTKTVLSIDSEEGLLSIFEAAKEANIPCSLVKDAGFTAFDGQETYTAVAVGPALNARVDGITGHLPKL